LATSSLPQVAFSTEIQALRCQMLQTMNEVRQKKSSLTVHDLRRLLFRCAATLISLDHVSFFNFQSILPFSPQGNQCDYEIVHYLVSLPFGVATPSAIAVGVEVWSWIIAEKAAAEVALMGEILSAWSDTIKLERGIFSRTLE
jgi:phosphatidylinositol 4-kinase